MNERTLEVLEYPRVRETVAGLCMSEEGRAALLLREPSADGAEVNRLKTLGIAWLRASAAERPPALHAWPPIRPFLPRLRVEGATLEAVELHALGLFCESVNRFREWAENRDRQIASGRRDVGALFGDEAAERALLAEILALPDLSGPAADIFRVIDRSSGEVRDLPELRAIRQGITRIRQDIERLVGSYLSDDSIRPMLQSTLPALRDGRQVIALRSNFRGRVRGIVHEVSQSGQTVYVEPDDVVDRNNDLVAEEHRLSREIARILKELTASLSPGAETVAEALTLMVFLDGIGAAARWGRDWRCVFAEDIPQPAPDSPDDEEAESVSRLRLKQARHPLLGTRAVPIDLVLTPGGRVLIITGPNTGGKTVSLKTVALFALLNQSGWPVPAAETTALPVFDFIGCDIGDEQSLDQSLSTFSGHMKNVAGILASATDKSLVLLDELASGTDPQEGSAIAMAVLDSLLERGSVVLATTHHGVLKNYGYTHPACVNASVDFDENTLSPTYRILMGVPGESHALDIAQRNGLNPEIVALARSYLAEERADVSALIKGLTAKHEELARFEKDKRLEERDLREKRRKTDLRELQLRQKEVELREQGYRRLERLFDDSRKQLENLVREIREGELTREKTLQVKAWMGEFEERINAEHEGLAADREEAALLRREYEEKERVSAADRAADRAADGTDSASERQKRKRAAFKNDGPSRAEILPELAPGVEVYVGDAKRRGTIVREAKKGQWIVATDSIRMTVSETSLSAVPVKPDAVRKVSIDFHAEMGGDETPAFELRLLGMRHGEAMKALERQLDLAAMKGLREFSVVHGKGHGILQEAVQTMLRSYRGVEEFHFARPEEGGTGKTVVRMTGS